MKDKNDYLSERIKYFSRKIDYNTSTGEITNVDSNVVLKTAFDWYNELTPTIHIIDNDDWRDKELNSWNTELITKDEYLTRLSLCTIE